MYFKIVPLVVCLTYLGMCAASHAASLDQQQSPWMERVAQQKTKARGKRDYYGSCGGYCHGTNGGRECGECHVPRYKTEDGSCHCQPAYKHCGCLDP